MNKIATLITAFAKPIPHCLRANFVSALAMAFAIASCTTDEVLQDTSDSNLISFGTYVGQGTKADGNYYVTSTTFPDKAQFGVMAYKHSGKWADGEDFSNQFMNNVAVKVGGSGSGQTFTYKPMRYWPITSKLSFLAYYPKDGTDVAFSATDSDYPTIDFTVQGESDKQVDLMYAPLVADKTKDNCSGSVDLSFHHALTRLTFKAKRGGAVSDDVSIKISSITVIDAASKGTFDFGTKTWSGVGTDANFTLANTSTTDLGITETDDLNTDANTLLMIPQTIDDVKIKVAYTQDDWDGTATFSLASTEAWTANKSILYTLIINPGKAVTLTATVEAWDNQLNKITPPTTIDELTAAVADGRFYERVTLIDTDPATGATGTWEELDKAIEKYQADGRTKTLDLTMSEIRGDIPTKSFTGCNALTSFSAPEMTGSIETYAFDGCHELSSLFLPKMKGGIGGYAFNDCPKLCSITFGPIADEKTVDFLAFAGMHFSTCDFVFRGKPVGTIRYGHQWDIPDLCMWVFHSITVEAEVPITVEDFYNEVGNSRFPEIVTLTDVPTDWIALNGAIKKYPEKSTLFLTMSGAFSDIPPNAFEGCDALFTFYAPKMTGSIGKSAFENCNTLINFYAPKMMGDIGEDVFKGCAILIKITFGEAGTADGSIIKEGAFNGFDNIGSCDLVFTGKPKGGTVDEADSEWTIGSTLYKFKSIKVHTE